MGKFIIKRLKELQEELQLKLEKVNKDIKDFADFEGENCLANTLQERIDGRLSTEALTNNTRLKLDLENELQEINNYLYYNEK
jgi:hypothetical protein